MPDISINYWAVIVATAVNMIVGSIWYAKPVFGQAWMRLVGLNQDKAQRGATKAMIGMLIGAFVQVYVLAHMIGYAQATSIQEGLQTGAWLWLGFIGAVTLADVLFAQRPVKLWLITSSYQLVVMLINGALLATWR